MLDDYKDVQPIFYNIITNSLKKDKLSHAYLIESSGNKEALNIAIAFAKAIFCKENFTNKNNCNNCYICDRIDNNNFLELKIIKPDGLWIKKEQLLDLQKEFSMTSTEASSKVYIITEAEKMNKQAANSLLKFLEEPEDNIIAILITSNSNLLLETIKSRCQVLLLNKNRMDFTNITEKISTLLKTNKEYQEVDSSKIEDYLKNVINFIDYYEQNGINTLLVTKKYWHNIFKTKEETQLALEIIILIYKEAFDIKHNIKEENKELDIINKIVTKNTTLQIEHKLKTIIDLKDLIKYNLNINLLIDRLIIELEGDK